PTSSAASDVYKRQQAKYVSENYALEKEQRQIRVWRKDGKVLSEDEILKLDIVVPQIFEMY
ncbi:hypothetical protein KQJ29_19475, partial [Enterococcus sp. S181_ASV_20]|nr:hypothetical protein [Enterococcus sp. S181_ASV_20]